MFENKVKRPSQRANTSKSTSKKKLASRDFIDALLTDTTGAKSRKSKSQCLSKNKEPVVKSLEFKKNSHEAASKNGSINKNDRKSMFSSRQTQRKKPVLQDNNWSNKIAELKWMSKSKSSLPKKKQKKEWDESKIPYNWETVTAQYLHLLTKFEQSEIKEYKKIYYVGHKAKKREKIQDSMELNFDNEEKQYNFLINDHIDYRFQILNLIGKGSYGQVFKVYDHKNKEEVALKMIKNRPKFTEQAFIEVQILSHIKENDLDGESNIIKIKDFVIFRKHVCMLFELLSENLYELIIRNDYNGLPIDLIRRFAHQILTSLCFLKAKRIIHCDLKPENILLKDNYRPGIKIIDFGSSCFQNQTIHSYIQSRYYRAPQVTFGIQYTSKIDIWSTGCILGELFTGVPLFPGDNENQQIKYLINTLGMPSQKMMLKGKRTRLFFQSGRLKKEIEGLQTIENSCRNLAERIPDAAFRSFLELFLQWDPEERVSPQEALKHPWIVEGMMESKDEVRTARNRTVKGSKSKSKEKRLKQGPDHQNTKKLLSRQ